MKKFLLKNHKMPSQARLILYYCVTAFEKLRGHGPFSALVSKNHEREKDSSHAIFSLTNLMLDFETSAAASLMMIESRNSMKFHESSSNLAVMSLQAGSQIPFVFLHVEILKEKVTMPRLYKNHEEMCENHRAKQKKEDLCACTSMARVCFLIWIIKIFSIAYSRCLFCC